MPDINRRNFVTTGASLLATGASMILLGEATAAMNDVAHDTMGKSDELSPALPNEPGRVMSMDDHHMNEEMTRCIQLCHECHTLCIQIIGHCLKLGGRYAVPDHIRLLMDCAQMCATNADFMARESLLHDRVCGLCAELCRLCADSCQQAAGEDLMIKQCVDLCRRCAGSCERMSSKRAA